MRRAFKNAPVLFLLSIFFLGSFSSAQVTHRNLLPEFTNPELAQEVIEERREIEFE